MRSGGEGPLHFPVHVFRVSPRRFSSTFNRDFTCAKFINSAHWNAACLESCKHALKRKDERTKPFGRFASQHGLVVSMCTPPVGLGVRRRIRGATLESSSGAGCRGAFECFVATECRS